MSNSNWESKFTSIMRDTESNLERVKNKLGSSRSSNFTTDGGTLLSSGRLRDSTTRSQQDMRSSSYQGVSDRPSVANDNSTYVPLDKSSSFVMLLNDKMDIQAKTIDQLVKNLQKSDEERDTHSRQVHELREEISRLRSRMAERGVDLLTEQKISRWQQEWTTEMQAVQSQLQSLRCRNDEISAKNGALSTSLLDLQRFVSTEVDYLRREINAIKKKTDSLNADLTNMASRKIDTEQREADYESRRVLTHSPPLAADANKHSVSFTAPSLSSRSVSASSFSRQPINDSNDIDRLRSEYRALLKTLEANYHSSAPHSSRQTSQRSKRRPRSALRYTSESNDQTSLTPSELDMSTPTNFTDRFKVRTSTSGDDNFLSTDLPSDLSSDDDSL